MKNFLILLLFVLSSSVLTAQKKLPNILFIPIDDLRPELGCYGNTIVKSPNIDALAKNGIVFKNAYCQQAVCNPSRVSVMTGLRPDVTKVWDLYTDFRTTTSGIVTLPQYFNQFGYTTISLGKTFHNIFRDSVSWMYDLHVDGFPFDPDAGYASDENLQIQEERRQKLKATGKGVPDEYGFIYVKAKATEKADVNDDAYYDGAQTTKAIEIIRQQKNNKQPFFLSVGYYKPHLPFNAPQRYWDLYNPNDIPLAPNQYIPVDAPEFAVNGDRELRNYMDYTDLPLPKEKPLAEDRQRVLLHAYYACVSYIDTQIGRLITTLKEEGLYDNTIIVLWGDHGWKLGEHNSWAKQTNFEIDTRVPFIISGNYVNVKNSSSNKMVELLDIYPTLCSLAGLPIPDQLQGKSLKPLLYKRNAKWKTAARSQFLLGRFGTKDPDNEKMGYSIRTRNFRYTEWYEWKNDKKGSFLAAELYDHRNDDGENKNVVNDKTYKKALKQVQLQFQNEWGGF